MSSVRFHLFSPIFLAEHITLSYLVTTLSSDDFVEFDLRVFPVPILKAKFKTWMLISRIMWALGLLKTGKSFSQERLRAKNGADLLIKRSQRKSIALVSHGLLNYFIEKNLKKSGYKRAEKIGLGCFSITKLQFDKQ